MPVGLVKFWKEAAGYGFITVDEPGHDVFVHVSAVRRAGFCGLTSGQRLRFEVGSNARNGKPMATDLVLLKPIIPQRSMPTSFHAAEESPRDIAEAAFMRR